MLSVNQLTAFVGGRTLFSEISFAVGKGERMALTGKNGAGKTTLFRYMMGEATPESGNISKPKGHRIGWLPQELEHAENNTVWDELITSHKTLEELRLKLEDIENKLAKGGSDDALMALTEELSNLHEAYAVLDGYTLEGRAEQILIGLGFARDRFSEPMSSFSGGWQMRVELAKLLLDPPDTLLLDEPTNHLDIEAILWLEGYLQNYAGAIIIISHDRRFLDGITNRTIELVNGKLYDYPFSYSKFREQRAIRIEQQTSAASQQQKQLAQTERFIERFRSKASKATQVQSRVKQMEKVEIIEVDDEETAALALRFPPVPRSGRVVVEAKDVAKSFGERKVIQPKSFTVERGDRIAFVGQNGQGKSTLARMIAGTLASTSGKVEKGHNVEVAYYAQQQAETLPSEKTALQVIDDAATGDTRIMVRKLLGAFLFSGEDVEKKVSVLSGGEKSRLALCRLMLQPANLLILDEPTNHLDMRTISILKQALMQYDGTLLVVSHDRDFLEGLTSQIWEFSDGSIKNHLGDITEYLRIRKASGELSTMHAQAKVTKGVDEKSKQSPEEREELKKQQNRQKKLSADIQQQEELITRLELKLEQAEQDLNRKITAEEQAEVLRVYEDAKASLQSALKEWEEFQEELEALDKMLA